MGLSDIGIRSKARQGADSDIGWWVPPQPARRWPRDEPAVEESKELSESGLAQAVEGRHLVVLRSGQQTAERTPTMFDVAKVLTAWRAAERELSEIPWNSPAWPRVHAELASLRAAYHRLFEERSRQVAAD